MTLYIDKHKAGEIHECLGEYNNLIGYFWANCDNRFFFSPLDSIKYIHSSIYSKILNKLRKLNNLPPFDYFQVDVEVRMPESIGYNLSGELLWIK